MKTGALILLMLAAGCGKNAPAQTHALEFTKDLKYDKSVIPAWGGPARELPDGRIVVANFNQYPLSLLSSDGKVISHYTDSLGVEKFPSVGIIGVADDGTILTLDRRENGIHLFAASDSGLAYLRTIPIKTIGWTTGMCVAGSRIYVAGMKIRNDTTRSLLHELDWSGNVLKSFAPLPKVSRDTARRFRFAQIACTPSRVVLAPAEYDNLYFFDDDGVSQGVLTVPGHGEVSYTKSKDPTEPKVRRTTWDDSNRVRFAPDGKLLVQYDHYVGTTFDTNVTLTFDEATGWSLPERNGPRIVTFGKQYAYGVALHTFEFIRYRYQ